MRLHQVTKPVPEINMIPMIDVIMMLLIFFLVATQMKDGEAAKIQLADSQKAIPVKEAPKGPMTVNILPSDQAADRPYKLSDAEDCITRDMLIARMHEYVLTRTEGEVPIVRIRADRNSELQHLQGALISCQRNGIYHVLLATVSAGPEPAVARIEPPAGGN